MESFPNLLGVRSRLERTLTSLETASARESAIFPCDNKPMLHAPPARDLLFTLYTLSKLPEMMLQVLALERTSPPSKTIKARAETVHPGTLKLINPGILARRLHESCRSTRSRVHPSTWAATVVLVGSVSCIRQNHTRLSLVNDTKDGRTGPRSWVASTAVA